MFAISLSKGRDLEGREKKKQVSSGWLQSGLSASHFLPGLVAGFLLGLLVELPKRRYAAGGASQSNSRRNIKRHGAPSSSQLAPPATGEELKTVFVVRQDLKMGGGKIASQCAHAAVGLYSELLRSQRLLLQKWEQCGQPKIVTICKNQQEMNDLRAKAERAGLPTFTVSDAGRTQVAAGSKTVLVIGPGAKSTVDSVTRHLRLL